MTEMKPSNDELQDLMDFVDKNYVMPLAFACAVIQLAQAELQRRQQPLPAGEAASVPAELVEQWYDEYDTHIMQLCGDQIRFAHYIAGRAAAYGREQAQQQFHLQRRSNNG